MRSSHWGFFTTVLRLRDEDLLRMTGTDAVVFLEFLRLTARILTTVALPLCVILIPIDVTYKQDLSTDDDVPDTLMYLTMGYVQGPRLWAHVILSYGVTISGLVMIYVSYHKVIRLRQAYLASSAYQTSYFSRALMATDLAPEIQDDASLRAPSWLRASCTHCARCNWATVCTTCLICSRATRLPSTSLSGTSTRHCGQANDR